MASVSNQQSATHRLSNDPQAIRSRGRREYLRKYQSKWAGARRREWVDANGPCCKCGSSERLEVDHINPAKKELHVRSLWGMSPQNPRRVAELAKCQVLCHDCHKAKTRPFLSEKARREHKSRKPMRRDRSGKFLSGVTA